MPLLDTNNTSRPLEILVPCVGCSDQLKITAPLNKLHCDSFLVATDRQDLETINLCQSLGVRCMVTDAFHRNGAKFDKGAAHEQMLKNLLFNEFVLFLDVDILLPARFSDYMKNVRLDIDKLYGNCRIEATKPVHFELIRRDQLCGPVWAGDWGFGHFQLFNMHSKWLNGKTELCPSFPTEDDPFGVDDFHFRKQFGGPHPWIDGIWHWDPAAQEKIGIDVYHIGPIAGNTKRLKEKKVTA